MLNLHNFYHTLARFDVVLHVLSRLEWKETVLSACTLVTYDTHNALVKYMLVHYNMYNYINIKHLAERIILKCLHI